MANESYSAMKKRHQEKMDGVLDETTFFAFSDEQFNEGMKKFGLNPKDKNDLKKIVRIPAGGFCLKERLDDLRNVVNQNSEELRLAMQDEKFAYQAFLSELCNHEYCITGDPSEAMAVLGVSMDDLKANPKMAQALERAEKKAAQYD